MQNFKCKKEDLKPFALCLYSKLNLAKQQVFLCVGSDKFVCDSLAPIVSEKLTKKHNINAYVYGGLDYNINAQNLNDAVNYIERIHKDAQIIVIDATLGEAIGDVVVSYKSYAGFGKIIPIKKVGSFSILGVVGKKIKQFDLNSTRLSLVLRLSDFIAQGITMAMWLKDNGKNIKKYL